MDKLIHIWDSDYNTDCNNGFNPIVMKLSSYFKQQGYKVTLVSPTYPPQGDYEELYVVREDLYSQLPPSYIMDDKRTKSCGDAMKYFNNYFIMPNSIAAVRPDYQIYEKDVRNFNRLQKAQYLQLTNNGTELKIFQDYTNSFSGKKLNIIIDNNLWDCDDDIIISSLEKIKDINNIFFKKPIKLKKILKNKKIYDLFTSLHFEKIKKQAFLNNYGNSTEEICEIIDLISILPKSFKPLKVQSMTSNNISMFDSYNDILRDLKIIDYAKQKGIVINFTLPKRNESSFYDYFYEIKEFANTSIRKSFIDFMLRSSQEYSQKSIEEILYNKIEWYSYTCRQMIILLYNHYEEIKPFIFREWLNKQIKIDIDIERLRKEFNNE